MPLSGKEVLKRYQKAGWYVVRQRGSHVQVRKDSDSGTLKETIPMHKELKKGIERSLLKRLKEE